MFLNGCHDKVISADENDSNMLQTHDVVRSKNIGNDNFVSLMATSHDMIHHNVACISQDFGLPIEKIDNGFGLGFTLQSMNGSSDDVVLSNAQGEGSQLQMEADLAVNQSDISHSFLKSLPLVYPTPTLSCPTSTLTNKYAEHIPSSLSYAPSSLSTSALSDQLPILRSEPAPNDSNHHSTIAPIPRKPHKPAIGQKDSKIQSEPHSLPLRSSLVSEISSTSSPSVSNYVKANGLDYSSSLISPPSKFNTKYCIQCLSVPTRQGNSYCSRQCGISFMLSKITQSVKQDEMRKQREQFDIRKAQLLKTIEQDIQLGRFSNLGEESEAKQLNQILDEKKVLLQQVEQLDQKKQQFEQLLKECNRLLPESTSMSPLTSNSTNEMATRNSSHGENCTNGNSHGLTTKSASPIILPSSRRTGLNNEVIDCPCCGHSFPIVGFAMHVSTCYCKQESLIRLASACPTPEDCTTIIYCDNYDQKTKMFCKKLKANCFLHSDISRLRQKKNSALEVCGIPLEDDDIGDHSSPKRRKYCLLSKKACQKHSNWAIIRKSLLDLEEISLNQLKSVLDWEESNIKDRMMFRRLSRAFAKGNQTIWASSTAS